MAKLDKLLDKAREHFEEGEEVVVAVQGAYETQVMGSDSVRTGILAATNKRLVFYAKKLAGHDLEIFPDENVSSFEASKGLMGHKVSFFASGNKVVMKWIGHWRRTGFSRRSSRAHREASDHDCEHGCARLRDAAAAVGFASRGMSTHGRRVRGKES